MKNPVRLFLVIPCYNEEKVITTTAEVLLRKLTEMEQEMLITQDSKIVFVNDGSKDNTWNIITQMNSENPIFRGINLSRNRGHQNALLAGLMTVKEEAEAVISLDADLQDDIGILDEFVRKYQEGFDVVYGVRSARDTDTRFKKYTASFFYKLMRLLGADDQIYPTCLQEKVQVLEQNPEMVLVFSASDICNMNGDVLWKRRPFHQNRRFSGENFAKKSFRVKNFYGEPSNVMFRRKAAYKTGEFHVTMGYNLDWEYWLRLSVNGTVGYLDQVLSAFRVSEQSETTRMFQQRKKILEDDRALIASCQSNTKLTLSKVDLWSHWFTVRISLWMKAIFLAFSTRKVQKSKMV